MFPTLFEDCKAINISDLRRCGYLQPNQFKSGVITWSRGERKTGSISISVSTNHEASFIELSYQCNQQPIRYQVELEPIPSNLGKGVVWYFVCPKTGKRCRKLHLIDTYFYHRSAYRGLYQKQTYSHKTRRLHQALEAVFGTEKVYEQLNSRYFKSEYNGKLTKRYLKLQGKLERSKEFNIKDLLWLFWKSLSFKRYCIFISV